MRHNWKTPVQKTQADRVRAFMESPKRVCKNCGAKQTKETRHAWGRVTGYSWYPNAGRCK